MDRLDKRNPVGLNLAYGLLGFIGYVIHRRRGFTIIAFVNTIVRASPETNFDGSAKYDNLNNSSNALDQYVVSYST